MNYQKELEKRMDILQATKNVPKLLLHSCCAPCSSYVLEYLSPVFRITVYYDNPNIFPEQEYVKRILEQQELIQKMKFKNPVSFMAGAYDHQRFLYAVKGKEQIPEGGERCFACYRLRMEEAGRVAKEGNYDYFTTTLSISPLKNAEKINELGLDIAERCGVPFLPSDFKKKNGYKRSIELSQIYQLYRQDYCGCEFSKREREEQKKKRRQ